MVASSIWLWFTPVYVLAGLVLVLLVFSLVARIRGGRYVRPIVNAMTKVPLRVYDQTIRVLKSAVQQAKLGREEELGALKRLDDQARQLERHVSGPGVPDLIAQERQRSPSYGGRSVFGWERDQTPARIRNLDVDKPPSTASSETVS